MERVPNQSLAVYQEAFVPLAVIAARLARAGTSPVTVVAVTEYVIRQRAIANAHETAAISQWARARR
jgi:hypothetical protein